MSKSTYDLVVNLILIAVWVTVVLLFIQRIMEKKGFTYTVTKTRFGLVFRYKLGIYAGSVSLTRTEAVEDPTILRRSDGWEVLFPSWYTDDQMYRFVLRNDPHVKPNASHANDLEIFRQAVLKNNDNLYCSRGKVYTADRRKTPR